MKQVIIFFAIALCCLLSGPLRAQTQYQRSYSLNSGSEFFKSISPLPSGNFLVMSHVNVTSGNAQEAYIAEVDADGTIIRQKTFGGNSSAQQFINLIGITDTSYVIYGAYVGIIGNTDNFVISISKTFSTVYWTKAVGGTGLEVTENGIQTNDGGYVGMGWSQSYTGGYNAYVFKLSATGTLLWTRYLGGSGIEKNGRITELTDGTLVLTGLNQSNSAYHDDIAVYWLTSGGTVISSKMYNVATNDSGFDIAPTNDGGYIVTGHLYQSNGSSGNDAFLMKLTSAGAVSWAKGYGGTGNEIGRRVIELINGDFLMIGETASFGAGGSDFFAVRTESDGDIIWSKAYGGTGNDIAYDVITTADGGFMIVGETKSFGAGTNSNAYIVKTDANGNAGCNQANGGTSWNVTVSSASVTVTNGTGGTTGTGGTVADVSLTDSIYCKLVSIVDPQEETHVDWCGFNPGPPSNGSGRAVGTVSNPNSQRICGGFRLTFQDMNENGGAGNDIGFDDPVLGLTRRNCACDVALYLESVIQLHSSIGAGGTNYIDMEFNVSQNTPTGAYGFCLPVYAPGSHPSSGTPGYYAPAIFNFINTGVKPTLVGGELVMTLNFGYDYSYCSPNVDLCQVDFNTLVLHELTHGLGFASFCTVNGSNTTQSAWAPNVFSRFDDLFLHFTDNAGTLQKLVDRTVYSANGGINTNAQLNNSNAQNSCLQNEIWLDNSSLTTARTNQPIYSRAPFQGGTSLSHFDQLYAVNRTHRSPGFEPNYVMTASGVTGVRKNVYSNQELRWLQTYGYTLRTPFSTVVPNRPPRILTNVLGPLLTWNYINQTPPAGNPDLYITTTTCDAVTVNLATGTITGPGGSVNMNISDPDGNAISVFQGQVFNIRGCGRGNNADLITVTSGNQLITFTPRNNFWGRAQFAFHLTDGIERGSYIVITVDITRNTTCYNNGGNLITNGNFEEGTQHPTIGDPYETHTDNVQTHSHYFWGLNFFDGLEQTNGGGWHDLYIREGDIPCFYDQGSFPQNAPLPFNNSGNALVRYYGSPAFTEDFNLTLNQPLQDCRQYRLTFNSYAQPSAPVPTSPFVFSFGFHHNLNTLGAPPTLISPFQVTEATNAPNVWRTHTVNFTYNANGATPNFLNVSSAGGLAYLYVDNFVLTEVSTTPMTLNLPPLSPICGGASNVTLTPNVTPANGTYTYSWSPSTGLSCTTCANPVASPSVGVTTTYTVTVTATGACTGTVTASTTVGRHTAAVANAGTDVTIGCGSVRLNGSGAGVGGAYLWSPAATLSSATVNNPLAGPTVTTTYSLTVTDANGCTASDNVNVTVSPLAPNWPKHENGSDYEFGEGIATNNNGAYYITGKYTGNMSFPSPYALGTTLSATPSSIVWGDMYLAKYSTCALEWAIRGTSQNSSSGSEGSVIHVDGNGNIIVLGIFEGTVNFGGTSRTSVGISYFLAKYNDQGVLQWVNNLGNTITYNDMQLDAGNNILLAGGSITKFNTSGTQIGTISLSGATARYIVMDSNDDIVVSTSGQIRKYDNTSTNPVFVSSFSTTYANDLLALDGNNDVITTESASATVRYLVKYNTTGTQIWITPTNYKQLFYAITTNKITNDIYMAGHFASGIADIEFGGHSYTGLSQNVFVAKWHNTGAQRWLAIPGGTSIGKSYDIMLDQNDDIFFSGTTTIGTMTFNNNVVNSSAGHDFFFARIEDNSTSGNFYKTGPSVTDVSTIDEEQTKVSVYPNPTDGKLYLRYEASGSEELQVGFYDMIGKKVAEATIRVEPFQPIELNQLSDKAAGMYILNVIDSKQQRSIQRIIVEH